MSQQAPSVTLMKKLIGKKIVRVRRCVFDDDYRHYGIEERDQASDGATEFLTGDGFTITVIRDTDAMAVQLVAGPIADEGENFHLKDVTGNSFWSARLGRTIIMIDALQSRYEPSAAAFFVMEVFFDQAPSFVIEYVSDEDHVDQIHLCSQYQGPECRRLSVTNGDLAERLEGQEPPRIGRN
jgi:hypothetical protein